MPVDELSFRPVALSTNCHLRFFFLFEEKRRSAEMEMRIFFLGQFLFFIFISVVALMSFSHFFYQTQFLSTASNAKPQFFGLFILFMWLSPAMDVMAFFLSCFWAQSYEHFFASTFFARPFEQRLDIQWHWWHNLLWWCHISQPFLKRRKLFLWLEKC